MTTEPTPARIARQYPHVRRALLSLMAKEDPAAVESLRALGWSEDTIADACRGARELLDAPPAPQTDEGT